MSIEHQDTDFALASAHASAPLYWLCPPLPHLVSPLPGHLGEAEVFLREGLEWGSWEDDKTLLVAGDGR